MKTGGVILIVVILIIGGIIVYNLMSKTYSPDTNSNQNTATGTDVQIQNFAFSPTSLTIKIGDTVTWTNKDNTLHTVTSDSGNELNSKDLSKGQTYSHKFTSARTYDYHCTYHNSMKGKIIVE